MLSTSWTQSIQRCSTFGQYISSLRALLWNKDPLFPHTKRYLFTPCINGLDLIINSGNMCKQCSCLQ